jgi:hypothetical protein
MHWDIDIDHTLLKVLRITKLFYLSYFSLVPSIAAAQVVLAILLCGRILSCQARCVPADTRAPQLTSQIGVKIL